LIISCVISPSTIFNNLQPPSTVLIIMLNNKSINRFRYVALAEGISYLILLGVAMPLKYFADMPKAVSLTGMLHGILFVAFIVCSFEVMGMMKKSFLWLIKAMIASIIPFGTFWLDKQLKNDIA
jgi:integral membrane protein